MILEGAGVAGAFDPALALANRMLEREAFCRERLAAHAGRVFAMRVGPASRRYRVEVGGTLAAPAAGDLPVDLTMRIAPFDVPALLADPSRFDALVTREGDADLALALADVGQAVPWFVERTFAELVGPILGLRLADAGRKLLTIPGTIGDSVSANFGRYVRDEAKMAVGRDEARNFAQDVETLRTAVDALAARVEALERTVPETQPSPRKRARDDSAAP